MTSPLEHDYIGLSEPAAAAAAMESLKETELRLGLPGSELPERKEKPVLTLGLAKGYGSGAKRGFSDAIDDSRKWVFAGANGSEVELGKGGALFSPRGESGGKKDGGAAVAKPVAAQEKKGQASAGGGSDRAKAQVVGWPPIRSYRKNTMAANPSKNNADAEGKQESGCLYVKVSMDGAPYLRKVDLKTYCSYKELSSGLEKMFSCFTLGQCGSHGLPGKDGLNESRLTDLLHGSEYVLTYEDKDGDWMLVGDVPWEMFTNSCKRLRIMKGSEAIGLAPRVMEKSKNRT